MTKNPIPQPPGPRWYFMRPFKNRGQALVINPHYNPWDYYLNDGDATIIKRWLPDFDADHADIARLEALMLTQFRISPSACQELTFPNIIALLMSNATASAQAAADGGGPGATGTGIANSVATNLREPPQKAFAAYRAHRVLGQKQADVATELKVNQGQVSRWVKQVATWIAAMSQR